MKTLKASKEFEIRFSEVDSMKVVWHGSYPLYLEDAREYFGQIYGLSYQTYIDHEHYAPIVDMQIQYKRPLVYGMKPRIDIVYKPTDAAKVVFEYEIYDTENNVLIATAKTVQVFTNLNYDLILTNPKFYEEWKSSHQI